MLPAVMFDWPTIASILLLLAGVSWYLDTEAAGDALTISQEGIISHLWNARERAATLTLTAVAYHARELVVAVTTSLLPALLVLAKVVLLFALLAVFFWIGFDLRINYRREKEWSYIGQNAKSDLWAASFFKALNKGLAFLLFKVALFLVLAAAYWLAMKMEPGA